MVKITNKNKFNLIIIIVLVIILFGMIFTFWGSKIQSFLLLITPIIPTIGTLLLVYYAKKNILYQKINLCVDLRTKNRTISLQELQGYNDSGPVYSTVEKLIKGMTLNEAQYACNAYFGTLESVQTYFQKQYLHLPIDEDEERSILHATYLKNYSELIEYIIQNKLYRYEKSIFESYSKNKKYTPLMYAVFDNNLQAVKYLLNKGVNINQQIPSENCLGKTALVVAIEYNRIEIAKYLKRRGANINIPLSGPRGSHNLLTFYSLFFSMPKLKLSFDLGINPIVGNTNAVFELLSSQQLNDNAPLEMAKKIIKKYPQTLQHILENKTFKALVVSTIYSGNYKYTEFLFNIHPNYHIENINHTSQLENELTFMDTFFKGIIRRLHDKIFETQWKHRNEINILNNSSPFSYSLHYFPTWEEDNDLFNTLIHIYKSSKWILNDSYPTTEFILNRDNNEYQIAIDELTQLPKFSRERLEVFKQEIDSFKEDIGKRYTYFLNKIIEISPQSNL